MTRSMTNLLQKSFSIRASRTDTTGSRRPEELSTEESAPGVLKVFGGSISPGAEYKSVLATPYSTGRELVKEVLERYNISRSHAGQYVLCDVIGRFRELDQNPAECISGNLKRRSGRCNKWNQSDVVWTEECMHIVGDNEHPLTTQEFWRPLQECSRRFEIRKRADIVASIDTFTSRINANARRMSQSKIKRQAIPGMDRWLLCLQPDPDRSYSSLPDEQVTVSAPVGAADPRPLPPFPGSANVTNPPFPGGGRRSARPSMRAPSAHPYFITLRGYARSTDSPVYVLYDHTTVGSGHMVGREGIRLTAPDVLPVHCWLSQSMAAPRVEVLTALHVTSGAAVRINDVTVDSTATLRPGDVVNIGNHYAFLYKPPHGASDQGAAPRLTHVRQSPEESSPGQGAQDGTQERGAQAMRNAHMLKWRRDKQGDTSEVDPRFPRLGYAHEKEDELLDRLVTLIERTPDAHCLSTAYLTSMCVRHSLDKFGAVATRELLSKLSNLIQVTVWDVTKTLADKHANVRNDSPTHIDDVIADLWPVILWLSNAVEMHNFFRVTVKDALRRCGLTDVITQDRGGGQGTAEELIVVVLEDVVKYTFQQVVYYLTKALYPLLPAVLEENPFFTQLKHSSSNGGPPKVADVVAILEATLAALTNLGVHPEVLSQLFCYLFFFTSTNLFNMLMAREAGAKYYRWSAGARLRGNVDALEEWAMGSELTVKAVTYLSKINVLTNLLATPRLQLLMANWAGLRRDFPGLNPEQLLKVLTEYDLGASQEQPEAWVPPEGVIDPSAWSGRLMEGFSDHPPLRFPDFGFKVDLSQPYPEQGLYDIMSQIAVEFDVSDDDGGSGLNVSQTLPVFTDKPQSPVYVADSGETARGPPVSGPPLYPGLSSPVARHASPDVNRPGLRCPIPPMRQNRYERQQIGIQKGAPPAYSKTQRACAPPSCDTLNSTRTLSVLPEPDLGDSGISISGDQRDLRPPGGEVKPIDRSKCMRSLSSDEKDYEVLGDGVKRDTSHALQVGGENQRAHSHSISPRSMLGWRMHVASIGERQVSPHVTPHVINSRDHMTATTKPLRTTGPLAMSSPTILDSTPCPSPLPPPLPTSLPPPLHTRIPPQPRTPAPTLDRAGIKRCRSPSHHDQSDKVVEVPYLLPTMPDGLVNGLRVLPLTAAQLSHVGDELPTRAAQKAALLSTMECVVEKESSVDEVVPIGGMGKSTEEAEDVFVMDLERGDRGLGLGLIDGLFTPLHRPGIYVRTLVPGEPAAKDGRLRIGDRILAVNEKSVVGFDYQSAIDTIRDSGPHLKFLVAQGSRIITMQVTASSC